MAPAFAGSMPRLERVVRPDVAAVGRVECIDARNLPIEAPVATYGEHHRHQVPCVAPTAVTPARKAATASRATTEVHVCLAAWRARRRLVLEHAASAHPEANLFRDKGGRHTRWPKVQHTCRDPTELRVGAALLLNVRRAIATACATAGARTTDQPSERVANEYPCMHACVCRVVYGCMDGRAGQVSE